MSTEKHGPVEELGVKTPHSPDSWTAPWVPRDELEASLPMPTADSVALEKKLYQRNVWRMELLVLLLILLTMIITIVFVLMGTATLILLPVIGKRALAPWTVLPEMWRPITRHCRTITTYVFYPQLRDQIAEAAAVSRVRIRHARETIGQSASVAYLQSLSLTELAARGVMDAGLYMGAISAFVVGSLGMAHVATSLLAAFLGWDQITEFYDVAKLRTPPVPQTVVEFQPQVVDQQETKLGPWWQRGDVIDQVNNPDFRNITLIYSNGTQAYSQTLSGDINNTPFALRTFHERVRDARLTQKNGGTQITFKDQNGNQYAVNPWQVFLFENYKSAVFVFDEHGTLFTAPLTALITSPVNPTSP